jgi:nitrate reductase alpha subunit
VRSSWDEVNQLIASANVYTAKKHGPDRVIGFSPIPAMSMISYAAGSRYLSLIGGVCLSFYDWYCDLPPSSPQVWGEQTDVPESADWYNSNFIIAWGSNVPQTRTPDAHFFTEVRYKGAKTVAITPDYSEVSQARRHLAAPQAGHRRRDRHGHGPCDPEGVLLRQAQRVLRRLRAPLHRHAAAGAARRNSTCPTGAKSWCPTAMCAPATSAASSARTTTPTGRPSPSTSAGEVTLPNGAIGFRWGPDGRPDGQVEPRGQGCAPGQRNQAQALGAGRRRTGAQRRGRRVPVFRRHRVPAVHAQRARRRRLGAPRARRQTDLGAAGEAREALVATVFDLQVANYGVKRGLPGETAAGYDDNAPYTPAWQEQITGVPARAGDRGGAPVRRQRRQDAGQVDGHHRRGDEPLVPLRHELPRHHQHADDVRLHRPERWRLGALRGPGKAAPADRLDGAGLCARLDPPAAADERHQLLLRAHRPVALREAGSTRCSRRWPTSASSAAA